MDKIIIADSSAVFARELASALPETIFAKICGNYSEVLSALERGEYKLVVLDLCLSGCDSFQMLRELIELPDPPAVLVTVPYFSDFVRSSLAGMGIGYVICKPCKLQHMVDRIQEMLSFYGENASTEDPLRRLHVPCRLSGSSYIRYALPMLMENPDIQLTKELYPRIGSQFGKSAQSIERNIRSAIHSTWKNHNGFIWQDYLDTDCDGRTYRPSNAEFFRMLISFIRKTG